MATMAGRFNELPLSNIRASKTNPRKRFDEDALAELAETIRQHGVLQPITVRKSGKGDYELVFGERRYRAAVLAGLERIPAVVREVNDAEVVECQIVENDQRQDLSGIERAQGYKTLLDLGYTVVKIAERVGRSKETIYNFLKLLELPAPVRAAVDAGKLEVTTASLIGRIPTPGLRAQACAEILAGDEPMTIREAAAHIRGRYMVELKLAPFALDDGTLGASACTSCPKQAKNNREQFPDCRGDICTDPTCYQRKCAALKVRTEEAAAAAIVPDQADAGDGEKAQANVPSGRGTAGKPTAAPVEVSYMQRIHGHVAELRSLHRGHARATMLDSALDFYVHIFVEAEGAKP